MREKSRFRLYSASGFATRFTGFFRAGAFFAYAGAVQEATARYLATLTDADLDATIEVYGQAQPRAEALVSIVIHNVSHAGEIAAIKGLQGRQGRPT